MVHEQGAVVPKNWAIVQALNHPQQGDDYEQDDLSVMRVIKSSL